MKAHSLSHSFSVIVLASVILFLQQSYAYSKTQIVEIVFDACDTNCLLFDSARSAESSFVDPVISAESLSQAQPETVNDRRSMTKDSNTNAPESSSNTTFKMTKSPGDAILRSIACPGWGQLYNESYWKAGLFAGAAVTVVGIILWNNSKFSDATARYDALAVTDVLKTRTYNEKEFYRDQRDVAGLWLLGVYTLAAVDAYVGAHLFDFDVSEKGVSLLPLSSPNSLSLCVAYRF